MEIIFITHDIPRVALITGGGSGIGFEIARQLGSHGAKVLIMGKYIPCSRVQVLQANVLSHQNAILPNFYMYIYVYLQVEEKLSYRKP